MPVVPSAICNSEDLAPFVRKAFASRKPETLLHHLRAFSKSIESEIQEVCKAHYQDFILATQAVQRIGDSAGRIWDWLENGVCRMESSGSGSGVSIVERRESGEKWGYGSHEDWLKAGIMIAQKVLGKSFTLLNNRKHMVPSLTETAARYFVTRFFARYISTGSLTIMEEGGTIFTFKGKDNKFLPKVVLKVHKPQFYWKIMARADLGLADAYINEDFSVVDKDEGLQNLIMVLIANRDANYSTAKLKKKRGWWTPPLFTATIAYAKYFFQHVLRQNTLTQARRNISRHYDLSNELFSLFLDDTMAYSCAIFKREDEDLRIAQLRKISLLIEKARINKNHHVLEMGCGWGGLAIEVVKQTGCHYTGITLSEEQLKYAEKKVKDVGLQDHIKFLLCDYRELASTNKYDRIIACSYQYRMSVMMSTD